MSVGARGRPRWLLPGLLALALAGLPGGAAATVQPCDVPAELAQLSAPLLVTRATIRSGQPVRILALGGGSTLGSAAGGPELTYPARLQAYLATRFPHRQITVVNKGVMRQLTEQMVERMAAEVGAARPTLVIWETGITDAVRGIDPNDFAAQVQAGVEWLAKRRIDVLLMDMQYSRGSATLINFGPYVEALRNVADVKNVPVFRRHELMKHWIEEGVFDFTATPATARAQEAARLYDCLGRALAQAIGRALE